MRLFEQKFHWARITVPNSHTFDVFHLHLFACIHIFFSTSFSLEFHIRFFYGDEFYAISAPFYIKNLEFISHGIVSNSKKGNFDWRMCLCMEFISSVWNVISCEGLKILEGFMASILNLIHCSCVIKWRIQSFCNDRYILSILECLQSLQKIKKVEIASHLWRTVTKLATIQIFHWYYTAVDIQKHFSTSQERNSSVLRIYNYKTNEAVR